MKAKLLKLGSAVMVIVVALVVYNLYEDYMEKRAIKKAAANMPVSEPVIEG